MGIYIYTGKKKKTNNKKLFSSWLFGYILNQTNCQNYILPRAS